MGYFSTIIRDSQRPPPAARNALPGRRAAAVVLPTDGHPAQSEAGRSKPGRGTTSAAGPEVRRPPTTPPSRGDGTANPKPLMASAHKPLVPSPADTVQRTASVETVMPYNSRSEPVTPPSAGTPAQRAATDFQKMRTRRRNKPAFSEPLSDQALGKMRIAEAARHGDDRAPEPVESLNDSRSPQPAPPTEPVPNPFSNSSNRPSAESAPSLRPASGTVDRDVIPDAEATPDADDGDALPPLETKPHANEELARPMPRPAVKDANTPDRPMPAAVIPTPLEQPPDPSTEKEEDGFPDNQERTATMPSIAAVPAPQREREGPGRAPRRPDEAPGAGPEAPGVRIGLLEVVVTAPESPPRKAERTLGIRRHIASRHYLRNL